MHSVNENATEKAAPVAFRLPHERRTMLVVIGKERRHADLSETLRDAVDEYIASYLREPKERAA